MENMIRKVNTATVKESQASQPIKSEISKKKDQTLSQKAEGIKEILSVSF